MEAFAALKLEEFERGNISRRRLIEMLTVAASATYASEAEAAAQNAGVQPALVNHISYTNPNFRQVADWYTRVFNLEQVRETANDVNLPFGKMGEQPYGVTAKDVGPTFLVSRTRDLDTTIGTTGVQRPKARCVVNHIAYTVADFDRERTKTQLVALGVENVREAGMFRLQMSDPFGFEVQISGLPLNALTDVEG